MGTTHSPGYRRQKRRSGDLAFVELNGVRHYLGPYGTRGSRREYHRLLAEWEANGREFPVPREEITVVELAARFLRRADEYYRRADGTPTGEAQNFKTVLRPLTKLYGDVQAAQFGPRALKAVRADLVKSGLARTTINQAINRLRRIFKWAVEEELVDESVLRALQSVSGLKRGRCHAKEIEPVRPVPPAHVDAVRPHVGRQRSGHSSRSKCSRQPAPERFSACALSIWT